MANQTKLSAKVRSESGSNQVKQVRSRGCVPAVVYGNTFSPLNVEVAKRELEIILSHAAGESFLVELEIDDGNTKKKQLSLIQEVQHHPLRGDVLHVDFHAVSANEKIEAHIPIEVTGEADGVKNYGGILELIVRELPIRSLPQNLPDLIEVDVTKLGVGDSIHVKDLVLPTGVEANLDKDLTILSIAAPKVEVAATPVAAPEATKEKKAAS